MRYAAFFLLTSFVWDAVRAALTATLCLLAGRPVLAALRRAARRANFRANAGFREAEKDLAAPAS